MSSSENPVVAIVGAGAMGAMYAAHFVAGDVETWLVARPDRASRLRSLTVNGTPLVTKIVDPDHPGDRVADLVIVAVKHHQLAEAMAEIAGLVGPQTTFLSVLNGLESEEVIARRFGSENVLPCIALAMDAEREGQDVRFRQAGKLVFGPTAEFGSTERLTPVQTLLDQAGLAWATPTDMRHEMWWKFLVNVGVNQPSAVMRAPYGAFKTDGPARSLMLALIDEVIAVGRAEGVDLGPDDVAKWDQVLSGQPEDGWTSMHQDVEAGRATEVEIFAGRVLALGAKHGIATPYNQVMRWLLP